MTFRRTSQSHISHIFFLPSSLLILFPPSPTSCSSYLFLAKSRVSKVLQCGYFAPQETKPNLKISNRFVSIAISCFAGSILGLRPPAILFCRHCWNFVMFTERTQLWDNLLVRMTFGPYPEKFVVYRRLTSSHLPNKIWMHLSRKNYVFKRLFMFRNLSLSIFCKFSISPKNGLARRRTVIFQARAFAIK